MSDRFSQYSNPRRSISNSIFQDSVHLKNILWQNNDLIHFKALLKQSYTGITT